MAKRKRRKSVCRVHHKPPADDMGNTRVEMNSNHSSQSDYDYFQPLSLEVICHILDYLPLKDVMKLECQCHKLQRGVTMHLRVRKTISFCDDEMFSWMSDGMVDDSFINFLNRCMDLQYIYGFHPRTIAKRRKRGVMSLSIPGIICGLTSCTTLRGIQISNINLLESIVSYLPHLEIIGIFKNRNGCFPIDLSRRFSLTNNPRVTSLHLTGVVLHNLPTMSHLKYLHLRFVKFSHIHPFRDFLAPLMKTFVMANCAGPMNALKYVPLFSALAASRALTRLELVRVPILGGLLQHIVEDSWRLNGFRQLKMITLGACALSLETDVGFLALTASAGLEELKIQPSLTKDSLFAALKIADATFRVFNTLYLGYVDPYFDQGKWKNDDLVFHGLVNVTENPAMITDIGMKAAGEVFLNVKVLEVYNCPLLHLPSTWLAEGGSVWSRLRQLTLRRCHAVQLNDFCAFLPLLVSLESLHLEFMFKEPPVGCSRVGLSAGSGLGISSALVFNNGGSNLQPNSDNNNNNNNSNVTEGEDSATDMAPSDADSIDDDVNSTSFDFEESNIYSPPNQCESRSEYNIYDKDSDDDGSESCDISEPLNLDISSRCSMTKRDNEVTSKEIDSHLRQNECASCSDKVLSSNLNCSKKAESQRNCSLCSENVPVSPNSSSRCDHGISSQCTSTQNSSVSGTAVSQNAPDGDTVMCSSPKLFHSPSGTRQLSDATGGTGSDMIVNVQQACPGTFSLSATSSIQNSSSSKRLCIDTNQAATLQGSHSVHKQTSEKGKTAKTNKGKCWKGKAWKSKSKGIKGAKRSISATCVMDDNRVSQSCQVVSNEICETMKKAEKSPAKKNTSDAEKVKYPSTVWNQREGNSRSGLNTESKTPDMTKKKGSKAKRKRSSLTDGLSEKPKTFSRATSTSDPVTEDDHIQVLKLVSKTLVNVNLHMVGVTDIVLEYCPRLSVVTGSACRVLKRFNIDSAYKLKKVSFIQCPKLNEEQLVTQICKQVSVTSHLIFLRPMHESEAQYCRAVARLETHNVLSICPPIHFVYLGCNTIFTHGGLCNQFNTNVFEELLFGERDLDYNICVIYDYSPDPVETLYNRNRISSWVELFTGINMELLLYCDFQEAHLKRIPRQYPWGRNLYRLQGTNENGSWWGLISDIPWLQTLSSCKDLDDATIRADDKKEGVYCPRAKGHLSVGDCLDDLVHNIAETKEEGLELKCFSVIIYVNMCDVSGNPTPDPYM